MGTKTWSSAAGPSPAMLASTRSAKATAQPAWERTGALRRRTTMLLAQQTLYAAVMAGDLIVTSEHAAQAFEMAMKADALALAKDVERLRDLNRQALTICRTIAQGEHPYPRREASTVGRTIEALSRLGFIEQKGTPGRGGWVVTEPLLRRYLAELP